MRGVSFAACTMTCILASGASAQPAKSWTFPELAAAAKLVVIAEPQATRETGVKTRLDESAPSLPVVEQRTTFRVLHVLSGSSPGPTFELTHFRVDPDVATRGLVRAPGLVTFVPGAGHHYLMFLEPTADGAWQAVSRRGAAASSILLLLRGEAAARAIAK